MMGVKALSVQLQITQVTRVGRIWFSTTDSAALLELIYRVGHDDTFLAHYHAATAAYHLTTGATSLVKLGGISGRAALSRPRRLSALITERWRCRKDHRETLTAILLTTGLCCGVVAEENTIYKKDVTFNNPAALPQQSLARKQSFCSRCVAFLSALALVCDGFSSERKVSSSYCLSFMYRLSM